MIDLSGMTVGHCCLIFFLISTLAAIWFHRTPPISKELMQRIDVMKSMRTQGMVQTILDENAVPRSVSSQNNFPGMRTQQVVQSILSEGIPPQHSAGPNFHGIDPPYSPSQHHQQGYIPGNNQQAQNSHYIHGRQDERDRNGRYRNGRKF